MKRYRIERNPETKLFYVVGLVGLVNGRASYIPVTHGLRTRTEAQSLMLKQYKADAAANTELLQ